MRRWISIVWCVWLMSIAVSNAQNTEGREFWLTYLHNLRNADLSLIVSSRSNTIVTVNNPRTGWNASFSVQAGQVTQFAIPSEQAYMSSNGQVEQKGLHVTSTASISLYASNYADYTYDATLVLPVTALGKSYIIQVPEDKREGCAEFAVVATENNTSVTITPHARTLDGHIKNIPYSVVLQRGEAYQVMSKDEGSDFSGSFIQSKAPIAVFAGHECANIAADNHWCDHVVEQQHPVSMWGREFIVTKTIGQTGNRVTVTAQLDNTRVQVNGATVATLRALESYTFRLTDASAAVTTSEPTACFLYIEGAQQNGLYGDPSSVTITPTAQWVDDISFTTFQTDASRAHFVNVVTTSLGASSMTLDGRLIADAFQPVSGDPYWYYAQIPINAGTHTLRTPNAGFTGYVYGMGHCESYAYALGCATYFISHDDWLAVDPYAEIVYSDATCYQTPVTFSLRTNMDYTSLLWNLGDGTTSTEPNITHTYPSAGIYTVTLTVTEGEYSITTRAKIPLAAEIRDTIYADICANESYIYDGTAYSAEGIYLLRQTPTLDCDSLLYLNLTVHPTYEVTEEASFPLGSSYGWHDKRYREAGTYTDTLPSMMGCDSVCILHLTTTQALQTMYDTIEWQPTYRFHGYDFPLAPVDGYTDRDYVDYTLCYRDKMRCATYRVHLSIIVPQPPEPLIPPLPVQTIDTAFCHTDTIWWNEHAYTQAGTYRDTVFSAVGIEGIYQINISDYRSFSSISVQNVSSYDFHGRTFTESGTYRDTLTNAGGCDSIVTLHLGIMEQCTIHTDEHRSLCEGETMDWNGQTCVPGNDYTASFVSPDGCDSIVTLHLTALERKQTNLTVGLCEGDYYRIGEERLTEPGTYTYSFTSSEGCDSLVTLLLYNQPHYADTLDTFTRTGIPYEWQNTQYTDSGTYTVGLIASNGCDSVKVLRLAVLPACPEKNTEEVYDTIIAGQSYLFEQQTYTQTGVYTHVLNGMYRCDSIRILHLEVNPLHLASVETGDSCANNGVLSIDITYTGLAHQVRVSFDSTSLQAGWRDTIMPLTDDGIIQLPVTARAGQYNATIELLFRGEVIDRYTLPIRLLYPSSVLEQAWNDVIAVLTHDYNGGYDFAAFQWFEDGHLLVGETGPYLYRPLIMGAAYSALLTQTDGTQMMTCPLIAQSQQDISLYPTIVAPRQMIQCRTSEPGTLIVYNALGTMVLQRALVAGDNILEAPDATGLHMVRIQLREATNHKTYKLIIR